jgi:hypothetical protein
MDWFSVHLAARAPAGSSSGTALDAATDVRMDLLAAQDGVVSAGHSGWDATVSVQADHARSAAERGAALIEERAAQAGFAGWPVVRVEAFRQDVLDAENERPTLPALVSAPEAAELLGVSAQRVHELATNHASFPEAVYELRTGKLWLRDAIITFGQRWERRPGRPRKVPPSADRPSGLTPVAGL